MKFRSSCFHDCKPELSESEMFPEVLTLPGFVVFVLRRFESHLFILCKRKVTL